MTISSATIAIARLMRILREELFALAGWLPGLDGVTAFVDTWTWPFAEVEAEEINGFTPVDVLAEAGLSET